ncbi:conserved hypothetical protein [Gammaproteobacteria bacterium]
MNRRPGPIDHPDEFWGGWAWCLASLDGRPTVGTLMALCEENYRRLRSLAPNLPALRGRQDAQGDDGLVLSLTVEEQSRYTTRLHLTYLFHQTLSDQDPDLCIRAYHDAAQAEALVLWGGFLSRPAPFPGLPCLMDKWRINVFLGKWLSHCLGNGHRFPGRRPSDSSHSPERFCGEEKVLQPLEDRLLP